MTMKKNLLLIICLILSEAGFAQNIEGIDGKWQSPTGGARIEITKKGDKYVGTIFWLKEPNENGQSKKDSKNPDKAKRSRTIIGSQILEGFTKKSEKVYEGGTIYDPTSGKTYSCKMTLNGDILDIRGFIGVSLLGKTQKWTRIGDSKLR